MQQEVLNETDAKLRMNANNPKHLCQISASD